MEDKPKRCLICKIVEILVIFGALNWGIVGIFEYEPIAAWMGVMAPGTRAMYALIGICAMVAAVNCVIKICPSCKEDASSCKK